ncbi:MAG: TlpA family protein disulfide reductase [Gemmatimonadota bacterium]|nr:TlpA family protein disulfide reductase [Gemmatimonadota bacterium]
MKSRIALAALVIVAASCTTKEKPSSSAGDGRVEVGVAAPSYATVSLNGDSVSLKAERGKVVLLNVWATWCHPCRSEIPELLAIHAAYQQRGLELIGVSVDTDGNDDNIRQFMKEFQMTFPIWRDPDERISTKFLTVGVPSTFLIDKQGILRWRKTGPIAPHDSTLKAAIERALEP